MIALGIFVLVVVGLATLAVLFRGTEAVHIDLHYFTINTTTAVVFLAGAVALALLAFGMSLLWEGLKRSRRRRKETKSLRSQVAATQTSSSPATSGTGTATSTATNTTGQTTTTSSPSSTSATGATEASDGPDGPDGHFDTAPRER